MTHFLPREDFATVIRATPLVSIDLILQRPDGAVLLGKRRNEPARDVWFVPGGRIGKDETLDAAFGRILAAETGLVAPRASARLLGVYEHFYMTNALGEAGFGTHYVVLGYELKVAQDADIHGDAQHEDFAWLLPEDLLARTDVHANTKAYFQ